MLKGFDDPKLAGKPSPEKPSGDGGVSSHLYSLYFKGLVSEDSTKLSGFGVAICGQKDDLLFQMKGPIHGSDITVLEAELIALKRGLTEAMGLGITHISIYCDSYPLYEIVMGRSMPEENKTALIMNDVQRIRERFASSFPIFVAENSIKYAYKLARETIVSEISIQVDPPRQAKPAKKTTCTICLDDDINVDQMFCVDKCRHRFCYECMKRHIEVRLLEGSVMRCPHYRCKSKLTFVRCANFLAPKVRAMWEQRIKEDSIPVTARIYCPNPRCSALMSQTQLSRSTKEAGVRRSCFKCSKPFCIHCKVPWHSKLSCDDYKRLHPNPTTSDGMLKALANQKLWRQCGKCQHMIELSKGCVRVSCRCGHKFCYRCGAAAGGCNHGHGPPPIPPRTSGPPPPPPPPCVLICLVCSPVILILLVLSLYLLTK
ncbi:hypothetical protein AALP_AA6G289400 [Arabis alpina]|uniref:RBR-type E3 ubiquitin transferase n=1 Tax=Arabis alpina TaxID=50452 RepID=A0A087GSE4_ARAAL|nr:hypothetical protein AALP_AA6G289400 [Arabis alpina]